MNTFFRKHFQYELWANQLTLDTLRKIEAPDERAVFLFSHILNAHSMWYSRVTGQPMKTELFQVRTLDECEKLMQENTAAWLQWIDAASPSEFDRVIHFVAPFDGKNRVMAIHDALIHLVNHSSYHRGQIVTKMKGHIEPLPLTTYIAYASQVEEVALGVS